jgi:hypothetical protein
MPMTAPRPIAARPMLLVVDDEVPVWMAVERLAEQASRPAMRRPL